MRVLKVSSEGKNTEIGDANNWPNLKREAERVEKYLRSQFWPALAMNWIWGRGGKRWC